MRFSETLNLDEMPTFTKLQVAERQLDRALKLFLDEKDYVCAITLAGASEEILGKLLEKVGKEHALGSFVKACVAAGRILHGEEWSTKEFVGMENAWRDALKHYTDGEPIAVPREAAVEILDRAIDNLWALTALGHRPFGGLCKKFMGCKRITTCASGRDPARRASWRR
jgi:hypothetical protein